MEVMAIVTIITISFFGGYLFGFGHASGEHRSCPEETARRIYKIRRFTLSDEAQLALSNLARK